MKIAVGTDDKKTIRKKHFGESQYYLIYEILNAEIFSTEVRENPHVCKGEHQHGQAVKLLELLHDCDIFMGRSMGAKSLAQIANKNIDAIITSIEDVHQAIESYLEAKEERFKYYNCETGKFCNCRDRINP